MLALCLDQIRQAFSQERVRSRVMCFRHRLFPFVQTLFWNSCNLSELKQPDRAIFEKKKRWKRIQTTFRALTDVSCLRSAHARRSPWEPPETSIVRCFHVGGSLFWKPFTGAFFSEKDPQMTQTIQENVVKNKT